MQTGISSLQVLDNPFFVLWQDAVELPINEYPSLQLYNAFTGGTVILTEPFDGFASFESQGTDKKRKYLN